MCKYPESLDTSAPLCQSKDAKAGLNDEYRANILDAHNVLRQRVANGNQQGQPEAANMMKLKWDSELEAIAQRFANECEKDGLAHDQCRNLKDGSFVGQNSVNSNIPLMEGANRTNLFYEMVQLWYNEVSGVQDTGTINSYVWNPGTGHYTQLVWGDTDRLGCGYVEQDKANEWYQPVFMKCDYAVGGNMITARMYIIGKACSQCPEDTHCSTQYPGLCTAETDESKKVTGGEGTGTSLLKTDTISFSFVVLMISIAIFLNA